MYRSQTVRLFVPFGCGCGKLGIIANVCRIKSISACMQAALNMDALPTSVLSAFQKWCYPQGAEMVLFSREFRNFIIIDEQFKNVVFFEGCDN